MAKSEASARHEDPGGAEAKASSARRLVVSFPASTGRSATRRSRGELAATAHATEIAAIEDTPRTCQKRTSGPRSACAPRPAMRKIAAGKAAKRTPRVA